VETVDDTMSTGDDECGEDAMSTLSHRTNELSLAAFNSAKRFRGAEGQAIPQFTGAKLTIPIDMPLADVSGAINSLSLESGCPANSINIEGVESDPRNDSIKLVYVNFTNGGVAAACLPKLHTVLPASFPVPATHAPPQATAEHVDATPTPNNEPPMNCRVRTCPHWGYGQPCFLPNELGLQQAASHGRIFHPDLYAALPRPTLASINWFKCTAQCTHLSYGRIERDAHAAVCPFVAAAAAPPPAAPIPGPGDPYASIRTLCPAPNREVLELEITRGTATADLQSLLIAWLTEAQAAPFAHSEH